MGDFHAAFDAIDEDHSGEITVDELRAYMIKNNYKENFVQKWLTLFDSDNCGKITYDHYCQTLGLVPKERKQSLIQENIEKGSPHPHPHPHPHSHPHSHIHEQEMEAEELVQPNIQNKERTELPQDVEMTSIETEELLKPTKKSKEKSKISIGDNASNESILAQEKELIQPTIKIKEKSELSNIEGGKRKGIQEKSSIQIPEEQKSKTDKNISKKNNETNLKSEKEEMSVKQKSNEVPARVKDVKSSKSKMDIDSNVSKILTSGDKAKPKEKLIKATDVSNKDISHKDNETKLPNRPKHFPLCQPKRKGSKNHAKCYSQHKRSLRENIKPGVILILLTGVHRGKRVVFLRQLNSGLLLVTGPFKINGCPLRRVHQNYVITTSTRLDFESDPVEIPEYLNDDYFTREKLNKKEALENAASMFSNRKSLDKKYTVKNQRKEDQVKVDNQIIAIIKNRKDNTIFMKYMKHLFSFSAHEYPHKMVF